MPLHGCSHTPESPFLSASESELAVILKAEKPDREMTVRFRLFDDGLGFRYEFPAQRGSSNYLTVRDEKTEFNFTGDHTLFCIPGDYDTDEYLWSVLSTERVSVPAILKPCVKSASSDTRPSLLSFTSEDPL